MKSVFKLVFDTGEIFYITANTRAAAIDQYCNDSSVSKQWVKAHCRIVNMGKGEA